LGDWTIQTYNPDNAVVGTVRVTLDGVGRVLYEVDDGLQLTMVERQGATCTGIYLLDIQLLI
jgi:hypothetical protein